MLSVTIIHAEADAEFAAWLQKRLEARGYSAILNDEGGDVALLVLSPQLEAAEDARDLVELAYGAFVPLIGVWRAPCDLPPWLPEPEALRIATCTPEAQNDCDELLTLLAEVERAGHIRDEIQLREAFSDEAFDDEEAEEARPSFGLSMRGTPSDAAADEKPASGVVGFRDVEPPPPPKPPAPEPPARRKRERAKKQGETEATDEPPQLSAFYPALLAPQKPHALMVFAHTSAAWEAVRAIAEGQAALMGEQPADRSVPSKVALARGALLTVVPRVEGLRFGPPEQPLVWQPPYRYVTFLFTAPQELPETLSGQVQIYLGPLIIGEIPLEMRAVQPDLSTSADTKNAAHMTRYDPIFASYSHRDAPVMRYFRRLREMLGQKMLVDIYDLRAGEKWNARLLEMIDQSAVFQLFWSEHSARSSYCRQEWQHALRYVDERPRFVQPVYWQKPLRPSPDEAAPELAELHFQYVELPATTRAQLYWQRLKNWLAR